MSNVISQPLVLNNGIYLQTSSYDSANHLDTAHLIACGEYGNPSKMTDLGIVQPFITAGYLMKPYLYNFSKMGKNRIYVDSHLYKWSNPIHDEPCYIMADLTNHEKPGIAGEKFKIKVNTDKYNQGYVLAVDPHSPLQLLVTEDPITRDGDGFILTVRLLTTNQAAKWFPKEYLTPNTKLFAITTVETEYSETYSDIPTASGGMRTYFNYVGESSAQLHYSITRDAAFSKISEKCVSGLDEYKEVIEMYKFKPGSMGYDLSLQGQQAKNPKYLKSKYSKEYGGSKKGMARMAKDIALARWVPKIEALGLSWLDVMVEQAAIWGAGGQINFDGKTKEHLPLGLFHQLNMGNSHTYNLFNFSREKFEFIIANQIQDRVDFSQRRSNTITIKTGRGGMAMVNSWLRNTPSEHGMLLSADKYIDNQGGIDQVFKAPEFTGWRMANGLGTVKFELAPGLDPVDANPQVNPVVAGAKGIGGNRLSSYMFIIDDITDYDSDNIVELVYGPDWDTRISVIQGKMAYMGDRQFNNRWQRSSHHPGFEVFMEKRHKAYWVKDVTKSLLIKPINPTTGRPIYDPYFGPRTN